MASLSCVSGRTEWEFSVQLPAVFGGGVREFAQVSHYRRKAQTMPAHKRFERGGGRNCDPMTSIPEAYPQSNVGLYVTACANGKNRYFHIQPAQGRTSGLDG